MMSKFLHFYNDSGTIITCPICKLKNITVVDLMEKYLHRFDNTFNDAALLINNFIGTVKNTRKIKVYNIVGTEWLKWHTVVFNFQTKGKY